jgi:hypothetical protein
MAETTKHRLAFDVYWRLGPERTIERLHLALAGGAKQAPSLRTLYEWSSRFHWQSRIAQLEQQARVAEDETRVAAIREMHERQAKAGLFLQQKGMEWMVAMGEEVATPEAAVRAIVEGAKLERLARGEVTDRPEVKGEFTTRLSEFSDEELDALIEHAQDLVGRASETEAG